MSDQPRKPSGNGNKIASYSWIYIAIAAVLVATHFYYQDQSSPNKIEYSQFLRHVEKGYVERIQISNGLFIKGRYKNDAVSNGLILPKKEEAQGLLPERKTDDGLSFYTTMIANDDIRPVLDQYGVSYEAVIEENWVGGLLTWLFPVAILVGLWVFMMRRMNPGQQVLNIGKNRASLYDKQSEGKVTFKDVAGLDEAKVEVEEVVDFLRNPKKYTKLGGNIPKGVLLVGPPGTGKTLLAKATAGEADVPFFSLSGSDFVEMFVGVGAARVRDLFRQAKEKAPCIVFIDEIDAIGRQRGKGMMMGSNDERENTLNQLLSEMDGFNTDKGVIIMAATNRPDILDSALMRPGRFDRQILIDKPDLKGRMAILEVHTKKIKMSEHVDIKTLASQTPGFAGAELANICNEAALIAARRGKEKIEMIDFQDAIEREVAGLEKKNKIISTEEREIVAYHESGHAIASWFLEYADPVLKVSIVPRGLAALGYTLHAPLEDRFLMTKEEMEQKICVLLGGRVAEEIKFGKISTGAQNDLERITSIAFSMVAIYGMSDELGYISYIDSQNPESSFGFNKRYSDETGRMIDEAVKGIIARNRENTRKILEDHREKLEEMAQALLKKEILDQKDLVAMLGERPFARHHVVVEKVEQESEAVVDEKAPLSGEGTTLS